MKSVMKMLMVLLSLSGVCVAAFQVQKTSMVAVSKQLYRTSASLSSHLFRLPETMSQFVSQDTPCAMLSPGLYYSDTMRRATALGNGGESQNIPSITERIKLFVAALFRILYSPMKILNIIFRSVGGIRDADVNGGTKEEKADSVKAFSSTKLNSAVLSPDAKTATTEESSSTDAFGKDSVNGEVLAADTIVEAVIEETAPMETLRPIDPDHDVDVPSKAQAETGDVMKSTVSVLGKSASDSQPPTAAVASPVATKLPAAGNRWAVASLDLSGDWTLIVTEEFKKQYDEYLKRLGQPGFVRSIALGIIGLTMEFTKQTDEGRNLLIRGTNARGVWERSLIASGADGTNDEYVAFETKIVTADSEEVDAEAWWEENGTVHRSWLRGVTKYGGGSFESKRYVEEDGKVLVCESTFHPEEDGRDKAKVTWKFLRKGTSLQ